MQDPTNIYVDLIFIILNFFVFLFNYGIAGKKIYILPTLSKITLDIDLQEMSMKLLKDL